jgi:hypothetical protein
MSIKTPPLGAKGTYVLKTPWSIPEGLVYLCSAVVSFPAMLERGMDILGEVYLPIGLTQEDYERDLKDGANIVVLMSESKPTINVPDTYIASFPDTSNIPYSYIVLSVDVGAMADTVDLSYLQSQIRAVVSDTTGVESTVTISRAPSPGAISVEEHRAIEVARAAAITSRTTDRAKLLAAEHVNTKLTERITALETIILDSGMATPIT